MSELARGRMTSDAFIAWAMEQSETEHYELIDGEVVAMAPERSGHSLTRFHIAQRLAEAVEARNLPCHVYPDGMAVEVDDHTIYEPDALVRCGEQLPTEAIRVADPVIIVEVQSPSTSSRDVGPKLIAYFRLPSPRYYLIVGVENRTVVHHERGENGIILTRIVRDGPIMMDPPGITLADCFPPGVA